MTSTFPPTTIWQDPAGLTEFSDSGVIAIIDTTATDLIDTTGIQIVDTGVLATLIPATVWTEDQSQ